MRLVYHNMERIERIKRGGGGKVWGVGMYVYVCVIASGWVMEYMMLEGREGRIRVWLDKNEERGGGGAVAATTHTICVCVGRGVSKYICMYVHTHILANSDIYRTYTA